MIVEAVAARIRAAGQPRETDRPVRAHLSLSRARFATPLPPVLAALERAGTPPGPLYAALAEAERSGVPPFDALAASGVDETQLIEIAARAFGVEIAGPDEFCRSPIDADAFGLALRTGVIEDHDPDGAPRLLVAARGPAVELLASRLPNVRVALASPRQFADFAVVRANLALAERAAEGPAAVSPELTVAGGMPRVGRAARAVLAAVAVSFVAAMACVEGMGFALMAVGSLLFATLNAFRIWLAFTPPTDRRPARWIADRDLPVYTVLVALYREGAVVESLLDSLDRLDYPPAKLDIKILTEEGDTETLEAIARRQPRWGVEVLVVPPGGPKTKPRALNAGLIAARGEFLTVFDAEDRPDPKQFRVAVDAFRRGPKKLGCVQARLAMDNLRDGWISRQFAIEYAALFDVVLPALSTLGLPIALGGTSNHFRVETLRELGGWDPGNVTEDADLGLRLARNGFLTETIDSVTWEEATSSVKPWIRQRTRWMKGYMVTAIVHGRRPLGLAKSLDPVSFLASQLLIGGVALTALAYPPVIAWILLSGLTGQLFADSATLHETALTGFGFVNMIVGFSAGLACGWIGVDRRCPRRLALDLAWMPFYWMLVGAAAWRALWQIVMDETTHWEKTTHGVSTTRERKPPQM